MTNSELIVPNELWSRIRADLLATPDLERAAVGFAGLHHRTTTQRLLLRDWAPVPTDDYLVQLGYHLEVHPRFWARHAKRVRATGEALLILHSHPRDTRVPQFSPSDDAGERALIPKITARARVPIGAVVIAPGGTQSRITSVTTTGVTSRALPLHAIGHPDVPTTTTGTTEIRFDRQLRALGRDGHTQLRATTIGIVGAGGLGAHVIQQLAYLGVGHIVVIDPDRVATTNLSRLVGARRRDAWLRRTKVNVARRVVRHIGGPTSITTVRGSITDPAPAEALLDCDVIIGATDTHWSRTILNAIAYQYYVPVLDLGVELQADGAMGGRVSWLAPDTPCLWCRGILDPNRVRAEQLPAAIRADELARGYLQGVDEPAPAVVSINGVIASLAVTELLARLTGFTGSATRAHQLIYRLADGTVRRTTTQPLDGCPVCSATGIAGHGELAPTPW